MITEIIIYGLLLIGLFAVCDNKLSAKWYLPMKIICSAGFLVILIERECYSESIHRLLLALIACFVGDIFMALFNSYHQKHYMAWGILVFMVGHVFLLINMCTYHQPTNPWIFILPIPICGLMYLLYKKIHLHMGRLFYPAFVYCYFVSAMALKAISVGGITMMAGALFFLSDFSILFLYFYHFHTKPLKKLCHYFNLATYYIAILLFIYSI
ncbi:MAG: lysoplasmalogenase [Pseudobutyrivibrio sp.]|nr:lysoplasmalogenase [Pseudobutyrivibrio sp.]